MKAGVILTFTPEECIRLENETIQAALRKSRPKIKVPFRCYIYCNRENNKKDELWCKQQEETHCRKTINYYKQNGRIIGEFTCDWISEIHPLLMDSRHIWDGRDLSNRVKYTQFISELMFKNVDDILDYTNKSKNWTTYCWHIDKIKIYTKPEDLDRFYYYKKTGKIYTKTQFKRVPRSWGYAAEVE